MTDRYVAPEAQWTEDPFSRDAMEDQEVMLGMGVSAWSWVLNHMRLQILDLQRRLEKMEQQLINEQHKEDE